MTNEALNRRWFEGADLLERHEGHPDRYTSFAIEPGRACGPSHSKECVGLNFDVFVK